MSAKFQGSERAAADNSKEEVRAVGRQSAEKFSTDPDLRRRACQTVWRIFQECGDPGATEVFEEAKKLGGGGQEIGRNLELALPKWCDANKTRKELCTLLEVQFSQQPETKQEAVDDIRLRVQACCIDFSVARFGDSEQAREFGRKLGVAAWSALDVPQMSQAFAAFALLQK